MSVPGNATAALLAGWNLTVTTPLDTFTFFAIGDFGAVCADLKAVARAMDLYATTHAQPGVILCLGDNFYPRKCGYDVLRQYHITCC